jgi:hypothetical protein
MAADGRFLRDDRVATAALRSRLRTELCERVARVPMALAGLASLVRTAGGLLAATALAAVCASVPTPRHEWAAQLSPQREPAFRTGIRAVAVEALELVAMNPGAPVAVVTAEWIIVSLDAKDLLWLMAGGGDKGADRDSRAPATGSQNPFRTAVSTWVLYLEQLAFGGDIGKARDDRAIAIGDAGRETSTCLQKSSHPLGRLLSVLLLQATAIVASADGEFDTNAESAGVVKKTAATVAAELADAAARMLNIVSFAALQPVATEAQIAMPAFVPSGTSGLTLEANVGCRSMIVAALSLSRGAWSTAIVPNGTNRLRRVLWRLARSDHVSIPDRVLAMRLAMNGSVKVGALLDLIACASPEGVWIHLVRDSQDREEPSCNPLSENESDQDCIAPEGHRGKELDGGLLYCDSGSGHGPRGVSLALRAESVAQLAALLAAVSPGPAGVAAARAVEDGLAALAEGKATAAAVAAVFLMGGMLDFRRFLLPPSIVLGNHADNDEESEWAAAEQDVVRTALSGSVLPDLSESLSARCRTAASAVIAAAEAAEVGGDDERGGTMRQVVMVGLAARCMKALWERLPAWRADLLADRPLVDTIFRIAASPSPLPYTRCPAAAPAPRPGFAPAVGVTLEDEGRRARLRAGMRCTLDSVPASAGRFYLELQIVEMVSSPKPYGKGC